MVVAGLVLASVVLAFLAQNSHTVGVALFWLELSLPLAFVVLAAGFLGFAVAWVVALMRLGPRQGRPPAEVHPLKPPSAAWGVDDRGAS